MISNNRSARSKALSMAGTANNQLEKLEAAKAA